MTKTALGKGFEGLIPTGLDVLSIATPGESIKQIALDDLLVNPDQPRKHFDEQALKELATSIKEHGIIQPLVVTPHNDKYRIVAGERRFRASSLAGLEKVPVIIRNHKELEELEIALVENVQRVDLSPLEQAVSIVRLRDQFSMSPKEISEKLGKAETTISNIVRLLQLPNEAIEALQKNSISEGHARAILALKTDVKLQKELLSKIIAQKLSVREAEDFVHKHKPRKEHISNNSPAVKVLLSKVPQKFKSNVKFREKPNGNGTLTVKYRDSKELSELLAKLAE